MTKLSKKSKFIGFIGGVVATIAVIASVGFISADNSTVDQGLTFAQIEPGNLEKGEFHRGGEGPGLLQDYLNKEEVEAAIANVLGMSVDEMLAAKESGTKLPELAEQQGVSMDDIQAALETLKNEAVDAALADGAITEEQAERIRNFEGNPFRRGHRRGFGQRLENSPLGDYVDRADMEAAVADTLGLTVAELEAAKEDGVHLPELAEQQGVEMEDIKAAMQAVMTDAVDEALADGAITQEQADQILERIENGAPHHRPGGRRGFGRPNGAGRPDGTNGQGNFGPPADAPQA